MYNLISTDGHVLRTTDNCSIPPDPANLDYAAYLAWVAEGNTPAPYVPPPAAPLTCTPGQFDMALHSLGLLPAVQAYVTASTDPTVGIAYNKATFFVEGDNFITIAATALGKTPDDIHNLFILANTFNL